jgi:Ras GTPase-activating-like protein IQGAP2/3
MQDLGPPPSQLARNDNRAIVLPLISRWDQTTIDTTSALASDKLTRSEFLYYDTKALFVQILRLSPGWAKRQPLDLLQISELASKSKNAVMVTKGLRVSDMLEELTTIGVVSPTDNYALLVEEINQEIQNLGDLKEKIHQELQSLEVVFNTIQDHNEYLRSQLETYKAYLQNVRVQSGPGQSKANKTNTPKKFSHQKLELDGVICETGVPENRRANIFFTIECPIPGTFIISIHYKGEYVLFRP